MDLQVVYNFNTIESLFEGIVKYKEQYLSNNLDVDYQLAIGISSFQAIFVIK